MYSPPFRSGFSLLEISIVLVIIGLLASGVLMGRDLLRQAELMSVISDVDRYEKTVKLFQDRYLALPGDMHNATEFWGAANADPATCDDTPSTGKETCDGNGDGRITVTDKELFRFWQQLANAELIGGKFTGVAGSGGSSHAVLGTNVPKAKLDGAGFSVIYFGTVTGSSDFFDAAYGHVLWFGAEYPNSLTLGPVLKADEAWNIDTKMDDGLPGSGTVMTAKGSYAATPGCVSSDVAATAVYQADQTGRRCHLLFKTAF